MTDTHPHAPPSQPAVPSAYPLSAERSVELSAELSTLLAAVRGGAAAIDFDASPSDFVRALEAHAGADDIGPGQGA